MKWIGQHIWDFISRFRSTVYIENLETSSEENVLVVDSDGKVTKNTSLGGSDLTISGAADTRVVTSDGGSALTAEEFCTWSGNTFSITSSASGKPNLWLVNTNADEYSSELKFIKNQNGADNDKIGEIKWDSPNETGSYDIYAGIYGYIADATPNEEAGKLELKVAEYDATLTTGLLLDGDTDTNGEIDVTIGAGASGKVDTAGIFRGSNIGTIQDTKILVSPTMFIADSYRYHPQYSIAGNGITMPSTSYKAYAEVVIPNGYTATSCVMKAADVDNDGTIRCYEGSLSGGATSAVASADTFSSGSVTHDFGSNDIVGDGTKTCIIEWAPGDTVDCLTGGHITIAKT